MDRLCKVETRVVRPRPCERFESQWPGLTSRDPLESGADRPYCNLINLYFTLTLHSLLSFRQERKPVIRLYSAIQNDLISHALISHFPTGLRVEQELVTSYPQVVVVRVPTPWVQSDSDITVLRHLEKMGCRLINRPQAILNCVNKFWTFQELAGHGVPLPDTFSYGTAQYLICTVRLCILLAWLDKC